MKRLQLIIMIFLGLWFLNSENDRTGEEADSTQFSGKVLFNDSSEPLIGRVSIIGFKNNFPTDKTIVSKEQTLNSDGSFDIFFEADPNVDRFTITIRDMPDSPERAFESFNCGALDCNLVSPGKVYENLVFEVMQ